MESACAFTGHRPHKLPFGYDEAHRDCMQVKLLLSLAINEAQREGVCTFFTGMAEGVDLWAASYVLELKQVVEGLRLVAVIPHEAQAKEYKPRYQALYQEVRKKCDEEIVLHRHYVPGCMQERNRYMVDHSNRLIAVFGGIRGGTAQTVQYAKKQKRNVVLIDPNHPFL